MLLKQAQPGTDKSPEANAAIAEANIAIRKRPSEFVNFKNDFVANNGYWNDAVGQQMYSQYIKDNPIISGKGIEKGTIVLNPNRQTLEQYANNGGFSRFGVKGNPQQPSSSNAGGGNSPSNTTPQSGSGAIPPIPASLPTGSQYSPSLKQWRDSSGKKYDMSGNPL